MSVDTSSPAVACCSPLAAEPLSEQDAEDLITRIGAVLDDYTGSDRQRADQPAYGGIFVLHRSPD